MPFLKPLASDLLLQEEQRRQKRRLREQQAAAKAEEQRKERLRKRQGNKFFFGGRADRDRAGGLGDSVEEWGAVGDRDVFSREGEREGEGDPSDDVIVARSGRGKNKVQQFGGAFMRSIRQKRASVGGFFRDFARGLNLPSKDEIIDGCEGPVKRHLGPVERDMDEEGESELEKRLREAVRREERDREREGQGQGEGGNTGDRDAKGPIGLFRNVSAATLPSSPMPSDSHTSVHYESALSIVLPSALLSTVLFCCASFSANNLFHSLLLHHAPVSSIPFMPISTSSAPSYPHSSLPLLSSSSPPP